LGCGDLIENIFLGWGTGFNTALSELFKWLNESFLGLDRSGVEGNPVRGIEEHTTIPSSGDVLR